METETGKETSSPNIQRGLSDDEMREVNRESNKITIGMFLFWGVGILACSHHGFWWTVPHSQLSGIVISLLAGAVAGMLMFPQHRIAALTCCPLAAVSGYIALDFHLNGRESVDTVEVVLVQCASAIPAVIVGNLVRVFVHNKKPSFPTETDLAKNKAMNRSGEAEQFPKQ